MLSADEEIVANIAIEDNRIHHQRCIINSISNDLVDLGFSGEEVPVLDGSAASFVYLLQSAGIVTQDAPKRFLRVKKPVEVLSRWGANPRGLRLELYRDLDELDRWAAEVAGADAAGRALRRTNALAPDEVIVPMTPEAAPAMTRLGSVWASTAARILPRSMAMPFTKGSAPMKPIFCMSRSVFRERAS